jgi:hypothetical protein
VTRCVADGDDGVTQQGGQRVIVGPVHGLVVIEELATYLAFDQHLPQLQLQMVVH